MTYPELQIQLDLNPDNRVDILNSIDTCLWTNYGYLFIDQEDGQCYLFDEDGNPDGIDKVKIIENWVFANCTSLTKIKIPDSVERIGDEAFWKCSALKEVIFENMIKVMEWYPWGIKDESIIKTES